MGLRRRGLAEAWSMLQVAHWVAFAGLLQALQGGAEARQAEEEPAHASVYFTGQGAQVMRRDPGWLPSKRGTGKLGTDDEVVDDRETPMVPAIEKFSGSLCNSSMIGIWRFHEHDARDRQFQVIRKFDGNMYFQEVLPHPHVHEGFRTGWLQMQRSPLSQQVVSCRFETGLTDGARLQLYLRKSMASGEQILEVSEVGPTLPTPPDLPLLARHPAPEAYSADSLALLVAVLVLLSSPLAVVACTSRPELAISEEQQQVSPDEGKGSHEDWMDALRLVCILFMVVRHAVQSLERLQQVPTVDLSFILHGLPLFVYVAGRSFGLSVSRKSDAVQAASWKAQLFDHLAFVKRRAMQLLLPSLIGTALLVIPTEYVGRNWRTCAKGPDAPFEWLKAYLFSTHGGGLGCEGLGWLGFMVTLFAMQAMLRPWAIALHRGVAYSQPVMRADLGFALLAISAGVTIGSATQGIGSLGLGGFARADTALTFAPALADLLSVSCCAWSGSWRWRWSWQKQKAGAGAGARESRSTIQAPHSAPTMSSLRLPALARRVVASICMAAFTKQFTFDAATTDSNHASDLWIEMGLLILFYQQGVMDGILRDVPGAAYDPVTSKLLHPLVVTERLYTKAMAAWPRLRDLVRWLFAASLWLLASTIPVSSGIHKLTSPGYRYPPYYWGSAGQFVFRSWIVLGLARWGHDLPTWAKHVKMVTPFGFTLYVLHWFFIELVMSMTYQHPHEPMPGDLPWYFALVVALAFTLLSAGLCHMALKAVSGEFSLPRQRLKM